MEKVKVTREQAEAIEFAVNHNFRHTLIDAYMNVKGASFSEKLSVLYKLSYDDFFRALYIGYEVEPEYKVGDWVYHEKWGIGEVTGFELHEQETTIWVEMSQMKLHDHLHNFRHATPSEIAEEKERRWWNEHGRELGKFKRGDILKFKNNNKVIEFWQYDQGAVEYFVDEKIRRTNMLGFSNRVMVVCFAENRLDVSKEDE